MIVAALIVGSLTDRLKSQVKQSARAAYRTNQLFETNQMLQKAATQEEIFQVARTQLRKLVGRDLTVCPGVRAGGKKDTTSYLIKTASHIYGSVIMDGAEPLEAFENSVLLSILGECALALENMKNAKEKEEAKLLAENEKLRSNLLRIISHDLRTPLTAISGNAGMLLADSEHLSPENRKQMYSDIYDDAALLN